MTLADRRPRGLPHPPLRRRDVGRAAGADARRSRRARSSSCSGRAAPGSRRCCARSRRSTGCRRALPACSAWTSARSARVRRRVFRARNLGLLDQHYARALSPDLTCVHTVGLGLELLGTPRRRRGRRPRSCSSASASATGSTRAPASLSGGEQQRVALCAALAHRPRLLLADEPAGELDEENATIVYDLIAELAREQGTTALVVSHDAAAASIADRLVYVRDGRVVEEGRPGERTSLVVTAPGWVRLPDPLLRGARRADRLHAEHREQELGAVERRARPRPRSPAPAMFHEHASQPGEVVAELRERGQALCGSGRSRCSPASRPRSAAGR